MIRRRISFALVVALTGTLSAAPPRRETDLITVETRILPFAKLKDPERGTYQERLEVQPENIRVRMSVPPKVLNQGRTFLGTSLTYEQLHFNYKYWDSAQEPSRVDTVHAIQAQLFVRQKLKREPWFLRTFVSGGFNSDFASVSLRAARAQGGLIWETEGETGTYGLGVVVIDSFGKTRVLPAFGFEQTFAQRHKVSVRVPMIVGYTYMAGDGHEFGLAARVTGSNARLEKKGTFENKNLSYSLITVGPTAKFRVSKSLALTADAGWTVNHQYQILSGDKKIRDFDLENSHFIFLGVRLIT